MKNQDFYYPRVGVGVIINRESSGEILFGRRKNSHGAGTWSFPGGKLEMLEEITSCAVREVKEETGLDVYLIDHMPCAVTNDLFKFRGEDRHWVTLYLRAAYIRGKGEPKVMEPDSCEEWRWFAWDRLPSNLFIPVRNLIKTGYNPTFFKNKAT